MTAPAISPATADPNDKAPDARDAQGLQGNHHQPTDAIVAPSDDSDNAKAVATVIARLTIAGFCVHRLEAGGFLVSRWNALTKHCPDARALAGFSQQVGAVR